MRFASLGALLLSVTTLPAQVDRLEVGLRLRVYERRLAACESPERTRTSLLLLEKAVAAFFRLDLPGVARELDAADAALDATPLAAATRFARALQLTTTARLHDPGAGPLGLRLSLVWPTEPAPADLRISVALNQASAPLASFAVSELPFTASLDLGQAAEGDHELVWTVATGETILTTRSQGLSLATRLAARLANLPNLPNDHEDGALALEAATLAGLQKTLQGMQRKRPEETVLPGASLLAEAESVAKALAEGVPYYGPARLGQHWLRLPLGNRVTVVRMFSPANPDATPRPLVIALHGAGGSENLFCDGYGDGAIVDHCRTRGYYLVAPRSDALRGVDAIALVDAVAQRWPIDRQRVAIVGHSMGAGQAIGNAMRDPAKFAAVAALGGGGAIPGGLDLTNRRFFVAAGSRDFALTGAKALHANLLAAEAASTWKEFPHVEHLAIVQFALPDVFAFFEEAFLARGAR